MRILYVVSTFYPNTAYTNRNKAAVRGFLENGSQCDVLSIRPLVTKESMCVNRIVVPRSSRLKTTFYTILNMMKARRAIKDYDVVYCATYTLPIVKMIIRCAQKYKKVAIHERTEMPDIILEITGEKQSSFEAYLSESKRFNHLFVISTPIQDYFIKHGVSEEKIDIFPMIVDPHRFDGLTKQNVGYKYIAYGGNMNNSKDGIAELIESFARSKTRKTHKLMLIGNKPTGTQKEIYDSILARYEVKDEVVFRGQVDRDEMPQLLIDADLLVLCRPNNRQALGGFPTKLGEYLSTGNPVLVTRVGDIDKYIVDGVNGYLAKPDDIEDFSQRMDAIIESYPEAQVVGQKGKELALDAFNYKVQTKKVLDIIESELKR